MASAVGCAGDGVNARLEWERAQGGCARTIAHIITNPGQAKRNAAGATGLMVSSPSVVHPRCAGKRDENETKTSALVVTVGGGDRLTPI